MKKFLNEFKKFALRGNVIDLAVGVIIGGAFTGVVNAVSDNFIKPIINIFTGEVDFSQIKIALEKVHFEEVDGALVDVTNYMYVGNFISSVISFLILMIVVFTMVKTVNKLRTLGKKEEEAAPAAPPAPSNEEVLLAEIRDLLKKK